MEFSLIFKSDRGPSGYGRGLTERSRDAEFRNGADFLANVATAASPPSSAA